MPSPLQSKDAHWRSRPNGATPVFDPGLAAPGTDEEAGGAHAQPADHGAVLRPSLPLSPDRPGGIRAPLAFWFSAAALIGVVLAVLLIVSL